MVEVPETPDTGPEVADGDIKHALLNGTTSSPPPDDVTLGTPKNGVAQKRRDGGDGQNVEVTEKEELRAGLLNGREGGDR